ncbi:MAG: YhbY family RNA-binding protein [Clostridia bacterium]|nr:YhbY family RNA-binding protein [Clostridia bacterium]
MISSKERKVLSGMGQKIDSVVQIGKNGVTEAVLQELEDVLEARELVKISVLRNCDFTAKEMINDLADDLNAEPVSCVGSKIVLYRKSQRKDVKHIEF